MTKQNTVTQLIHDVDALHDCLDQNILFFSDYVNAFDSVPHELLIKKLPSFDFDRNITILLTSYLSDRSQYVSSQ